MRKSILAAITAICFQLPLGAQEPQVPPPDVMANPLFHNPFAGQPQTLKAPPPGWPSVTVKPSPKTEATATTCAIPLLNAAPKEAAHYTMPTVSPQKGLDPKAFVPSIPVCGVSQQSPAILLKK